MPNPFDQFDAAPQSMTLGAPDPFKVRDQQLQEEANRRAADAASRADAQFNYQKQRDATQDARINQKEIPVTAASGIQENINTLHKIEQAIQALDKRPGSIGPGTGAFGDTFTQLNDPEGNDTRQRVGEIGAYKIHDLSGAAVSASEAPRFSAFVPKVNDTPDKALTNLKNFRDNLKSQIKESLDFYTPANGYKPYQTPQAEQFRQAPEAPVEAPSQTEGRFGDQPAPPDRGAKHGDEFRSSLYSALASKQLKTPAQINAFVDRFNQANRTQFKIDWNSKETRLAIRAAMEGRAFNVETPPDPLILQKLNELRQGGTTGVNAAGVGATDAVTLGTADELSAAGAALRGSLSGEGSFRDLFNSNVNANRLFEHELQGQHPVAFGAGQLAGGLILPAGAARTPAQLAKVGALYGGAYGLGSGEGVGDRLTQGVIGAGVGAGLGYALPNALNLIPRREPKAIPDLVNATGRLDEPLEAAGPAGRIRAARQFGIDLPMGSAGDRTASLIEKGLDNLPGSAGVMNDARRVTEGQVQNAVEDVAGQFGSSRTLNEAGSEAQRGAQEWMNRFDSATSKAYNAIPISNEAPTTLNNTIATLEQLSGKLESNPELAEEVRDPILGRFLTALQGKGLSWNDLKEFRTFVGNKIGQFRFSEDARTGDYRALYAALSEDMRNSAAAQGPGALRAFDRANSIYQQGQQRIEQVLTQIVGKDSLARPELAAAKIQAMTKGGKSTGDLKALAQVKASTVKSGAWDEIAATLIRMGGQPANSQGRAFDPAVFVRWYADMAEPARGMLFKPELRKTLDQFVAVNQRLAGSNALRNTSNTVPGMFSGGALLTAGAALLDPSLGGTLAASMGANYGMAKLWTSPAFVKWATGYSRAAASGSEHAVKSQVGRLSKLATTNPELRSPIENLLKSIANDNAVPAVAASEPSPEQQQ